MYEGAEQSLSSIDSGGDNSPSAILLKALFLYSPPVIAAVVLPEATRIIDRAFTSAVNLFLPTGADAAPTASKATLSTVAYNPTEGKQYITPPAMQTLKPTPTPTPEVKTLSTSETMVYTTQPITIEHTKTSTTSTLYKAESPTKDPVIITPTPTPTPESTPSPFIINANIEYNKHEKGIGV